MLLKISCSQQKFVITSYSIHYTKLYDFFDEDGMLKSSEEIVNQLNTAFSEFDGGTFMDSFITRVNDGGKIALEDLQNELRNLGIPEEALNGITVITSYSIHYTKLYEWGRF